MNEKDDILDGLAAYIDAIECARSLRTFVERAWHTVNPNTPFVPGRHIDAICEHLEAVSRGDISKLLVNQPPRHAKSSLIAVFWPAWEWLTHPEIQWIYASYSARLSQRDSVNCRRVIDSPWYQMRWGSVFSWAEDQNTKNFYKNNKSGHRIATSVGGGATGEGGDRIVCDDPHNAIDIHSEAKRGAAIDWWKYSMSTRVNNPKSAAKVVVMQRLHDQDLSAVLLEEGGWEHLCLQAEYDTTRRCSTSIGWSDWREEDGEPLWPERYGKAELAINRVELGSAQYAGQFQQDPSPIGGNIIKDKWFRYWTGVRAPEGARRWLMSWDLAFKDLRSSSYVVGQVWCCVGAAEYYLVDQVRGQWDIIRTMEEVRKLSNRWPEAKTKLIEDKANGPAVVSMLKREVNGMLAWPPKGNKSLSKYSNASKEGRLFSVAPLFEAGNVFLPDLTMGLAYSWVSEYIVEITRFPRAKDDDQVDTTSMALIHYTQGPKVTMV